MSDKSTRLSDGDLTITLVAAAQTGNVAAMEALIEQFQGLLRATARRYQNSTSYEDAYQEACVAFLGSVRAFRCDIGVPFPAFASAKVRGDVRTAMRRVWRYEKLIMDLVERDGDSDGRPNEVWDEICQGQSDSTAAEERMFWQNVIEKAGLSARERVYVTGLMMGRTMRETAQLCGVSVDTVKTWRKRALRKLRAVVANG